MSAPAVIPGFAQATAELDGVRLAYKHGGDADGPPVLLWHGFLGTSYSWRKLAPKLAERGYAVLIPDMRGYGDSDKPGGETGDGYDGRALVRDFRALVERTGFGNDRPLTLIAHDMGAAPALLWAADRPDEIAALAYIEEPVLLADTLADLIRYTPQATQLGGLWWWMMAHAPGMAERLIAGGHERAFLTWNYDHYAAEPNAIEPSAVEEYLRSFAGTHGVAGAFGIYRAVPDTVEQTAGLAEHKIATPVLALGGEYSLGAHVRAMVEQVAVHVDGGAVPGCGHFIPEERPETLRRRLTELLPASE